MRWQWRSDPAARAAAASVTAHPEGFCFCGIAEEPPPSSRASPTSNCMRRLTSRATLRKTARIDAARRDERREVVVIGVPRRGRTTDAELMSQSFRDLNAVGLEGSQRPRRPAKLEHDGFATSRVHAGPSALYGRIPSGDLQAERRSAPPAAAPSVRSSHRLCADPRASRSDAASSLRDRARSDPPPDRRAARVPYRRCPGWSRPSARSRRRQDRSRERVR